MAGAMWHDHATAFFVRDVVWVRWPSRPLCSTCEPLKEFPHKPVVRRAVQGEASACEEQACWGSSPVWRTVRRDSAPRRRARSRRRSNPWRRSYRRGSEKHRRPRSRLCVLLAPRHTSEAWLVQCGVQGHLRMRNSVALSDKTRLEGCSRKAAGPPSRSERSPRPATEPSNHPWSRFFCGPTMSQKRRYFASACACGVRLIVCRRGHSSAE